MYRIPTQGSLVRLLVWLVAAAAWVVTILVWGGGFSQLLEYLNDLF